MIGKDYAEQNSMTLKECPVKLLQVPRNNSGHYSLTCLQVLPCSFGGLSVDEILIGTNVEYKYRDWSWNQTFKGEVCLPFWDGEVPLLSPLTQKECREYYKSGQSLNFFGKGSKFRYGQVNPSMITAFWCLLAGFVVLVVGLVVTGRKKKPEEAPLLQQVSS